MLKKEPLKNDGNEEAKHTVSVLLSDKRFKV